MRLGTLPDDGMLRDRFEVELARAITGGPLSLTTDFGPRTEMALIDLAWARPGIHAAAIARARRFFASENNVAAEAVSAPRWLRGLFHRSATAVAAAVMAWYSAQSADEAGSDALADHRSARLECYRSWGELDSVDLEVIATWLHIYGPQLEWLRAQSESRNTAGPEAEPAVGRLDPEAHARSYADDIAPALFSGRIATQDRPTAIVHTGVAATPEPGKAVMIDSAVLAGFHPGWWNASASADPAGRAAVAADVAAWIALAVEEVCDGRADLVLALGSDAAAEYLPLLGSRGYRVRVESGAAPDPIDRLAALLGASCADGQWQAPMAVSGRASARGV